MKLKDIITALIVLLLLFLVILYEYKESKKQIPTSASKENKESLFNGVTSNELSRLIENKHKFLLIDVRTKSEFNKGHISGAISIPFSQIKSDISQYNKKDSIILYCESGPWSKVAYKDLKNLGFDNVRILINGIVGWKWEIKGTLTTSD